MLHYRSTLDLMRRNMELALRRFNTKEITMNCERFEHIEAPVLIRIKDYDNYAYSRTSALPVVTSHPHRSRQPREFVSIWRRQLIW